MELDNIGMNSWFLPCIVRTATLRSIRKNGKRRGKQNHICTDCGRQFIDVYEKRYVTPNQ
jgi:transposase-like protein